jgi:hypothetical protein
MNEQATWALKRHQMYLKGGATRHKLMNEGGLRGAVDAKSADDLLGLVEKWCLGVQGRKFLGDENGSICTEDQRFHGATVTPQNEGEKQDVAMLTPSGPSSETIPPGEPREVEVLAPQRAMQVRAFRSSRSSLTQFVLSAGSFDSYRKITLARS